MNQHQQITKVNIDNVVAWMEQHGRPCYAIQINELQCTRSEIEAEAGRYGQFCEFTQKTLKQIDEAIAEVKQAAWDRFYDWATD